MARSITKRVLTLALSVLLLGAAVTGTASATASTPQYPVPYSLAGGFFGNPAAGIDPNVSPAGSNIWSCEPSAAHPDPVVLLHGLGANQGLNWSTMSPLLANNGYCVFSLTYGANFWLPSVGGLGSIADSAKTVSALVDKVLAKTGAAKVDFVAHSEGTTVAAYYTKVLGGAPKVGKLVGFSPNYAGTTLYGLTALGHLLPPPLSGILGAVCQACRDFYPGSDFNKALDAGGTAAVPGVQYTNIQGAFDEVVLPNSSGRLTVPNATNVRTNDGCALDNSDHITTVASKRGGQLMLNALDPAHPGPLPCAYNPPFLN